MGSGAAMVTGRPDVPAPGLPLRRGAGHRLSRRARRSGILLVAVAVLMAVTGVILVLDGGKGPRPAVGAEHTAYGAASGRRRAAAGSQGQAIDPAFFQSRFVRCVRAGARRPG